MGSCWSGEAGPSAAGAAGGAGSRTGLAARQVRRKKSRYESWLDHPDVKRFTIERAVGAGGYAEVHLARDRSSGRYAAIKVVSLTRAKYSAKGEMTDKEEETLENECKFLPMLSHPNIVSCSVVLETRSHLVMIEEFCGGGELLKRMACEPDITEAKICAVFAQIMRAVQYCHMLGIVHRDIKPENIIFAGMDMDDKSMPLTPKLLDFGLAALIKPGEVLRGCVGSPGFIAPEAITNQPHSLSMDIWSMGALLFTILTGRHPFSKVDVNSLFYGKKSIKDAPGVQCPQFLALSEPARQLLLWMLADTPQERPTAKQVLEHAWIKEGGGPDTNKLAVDSIKERFANIANMRRAKGLAFAMKLKDQEATDFQGLQAKAAMMRMGTLKRTRERAEHLGLVSDYPAAEDDNEGDDDASEDPSARPSGGRKSGSLRKLEMARGSGNGPRSGSLHAAVDLDRVALPRKSNAGAEGPDMKVFNAIPKFTRAETLAVAQNNGLRHLAQNTSFKAVIENANLPRAMSIEPGTVQMLQHQDLLDAYSKAHANSTPNADPAANAPLQPLADAV